MFVLQEKVNGGFKNVSGKFQYGQVGHAERRAQKIYGGTLDWYDVGPTANDPTYKVGKDDKGKVWYKVKIVSNNPKNQASIKPGEAPYKHKGYEIWNMGGRHWAYRKPRTDNYIGQFKTVAAAMKGIDKLKKGRKKNPEHEIRELILYAENTEPLYNQYRYIMRNLARKHERGIYDPKKAAILWKHWIDEAVKSYNVEILGGRRSLVQNVFTVQDRKDAAAQMEAAERENVQSGEYLLLNPKGRKKMAKKRRSAKQLANDKRLGRMAKARAKKKRGGRRKVAKRKVTKRRANPKRTTRAKSHLQIVFKCKGNAIYFLTLRAAKLGWTLTKGDAIFFSTKSQARRTAQNVTIPHDWSLAIAPSNLPAAGLVADCKRQVAGKA